MPWPSKIARQFQIIPEFPAEVGLHGPYNKLLNHLFHPESEYTVIPRTHLTITAKERKLNPDTGKPPELKFMLFEVQYENLPVMVVLITSPAVIESPLAREMADAELRKELADLAQLCPLNTLRGVSAFGTKLCFFSVDTKAATPEIYPSAITRRSQGETEDVAPRDRWAFDLMAEDGERQLREIVANIKLECEMETRDSKTDTFMAEN